MRERTAPTMARSRPGPACRDPAASRPLARLNGNHAHAGDGRAGSAAAAPPETTPGSSGGPDRIPRSARGDARGRHRRQPRGGDVRRRDDARSHRWRRRARRGRALVGCVRSSCAGRSRTCARPRIAETFGRACAKARDATSRPHARRARCAWSSWPKGSGAPDSPARRQLRRRANGSTLPRDAERHAHSRGPSAKRASQTCARTSWTENKMIESAIPAACATRS